MRTTGSPAHLESRRRLAVARHAEGYSTQEVADFLGVDPSSVRRWVAASRRGPDGLTARPAPGRPAKLTAHHEKVVRRWLQDCPTAFGFATQLWTAARLAELIRDELGVSVNRRYLSDWLRRHRFSPQKPCRVARERDDRAIPRWLATDWPRLKKRLGGAARP